MLGDAGANALGALLGTAAAATLPRTARIAALAVVLGLTAASEVVSFTKVIERTPPLHWLDMAGRWPAAIPAAPPEPETPAGPAATAPRPPARQPPPARDRPGCPGHRAGRRAEGSERHRARRRADRRADRAGPGGGPRPPDRLRAHRRELLPRHGLRDGQPAAEHHLRHRPRRRADGHHGAGAGGPGGALALRPGRRPGSQPDQLGPADLDDRHPGAGQRGAGASRPGRSCRC